MPILYNFHIFLATFYMIYWTKLLIQCPVPILVFCMFFCIAEYPYQMKPKCNKFLRRIILEYMWFLGVGITANGGPHRPRYTRVRPRPLARGGGCSSPHMTVGVVVRAQGSLYPAKKLCKKINVIRVTDLRNIRNGFWPDLGDMKQKRIEREIQSRRGSRPSAAMETKYHRGKPSPT